MSCFDIAQILSKSLGKVQKSTQKVGRMVLAKSVEKCLSENLQEIRNLVEVTGSIIRSNVVKNYSFSKISGRFSVDSWNIFGCFFQIGNYHLALLGPCKEIQSSWTEVLVFLDNPVLQEDYLLWILVYGPHIRSKNNVY